MKIKAIDGNTASMNQSVAHHTWGEIYNYDFFLKEEGETRYGFFDGVWCESTPINYEDVMSENEAWEEDRFNFPDMEFPTKDRTSRSRRRKNRAHKVNHRKATFAAVTGESPEKPGKLAKGKGITHLPRGWKWRMDTPSMSQYRAETAAMETLKEFYKSEGNLSYESINDSDWEYDEGWCDLEYEQEYRLEAEREMMLDEIRNVKTVAQAVYLAARFGEEIEWNAMCEYGGPDYANLYREGVELLAEEMSLREDQTNSYIMALEDFTWQ